MQLPSMALDSGIHAGMTELLRWPKNLYNQEELFTTENTIIQTRLLADSASRYIAATLQLAPERLRDLKAWPDT